MMIKLKLLALLLLLLLTSGLAGCLTAGLGPKFTQPVKPAPGKAVIYVYRERVATTGNEMPGIEMNGAPIVSSMPQLNYFPILVAPGSYKFTPKLFGMYKTTPVTIDARAGRTYYVRFNVLFGHLEFARMNQDEAMAYMATCYRINPGYVKDQRVMISASSSVPDEAPGSKAQTASHATTSARGSTKVDMARLYVDATPVGSRVRIMNIGPKFTQGIKLKGGRYHVEVTAPGHAKYLQWITLAAGQKKHLSVKLKPVAVQDRPVVSKAKPVVVARPKRVIKAPASATAEERRFAGMLEAGSAVDIRNAAKNIYYRYPTSRYLARVAEQSLLQNYRLQAGDNMHVDAMAWLCKALARSGDSRFVATLQAVADKAPSRKLRKYARQSLAKL